MSGFSALRSAQQPSGERQYEHCDAGHEADDDHEAGHRDAGVTHIVRAEHEAERRDRKEVLSGQCAMVSATAAFRP